MDSDCDHMYGGTMFFVIVLFCFFVASSTVVDEALWASVCTGHFEKFVILLSISVVLQCARSVEWDTHATPYVTCRASAVSCWFSADCRFYDKIDLLHDENIHKWQCCFAFAFLWYFTTSVS